MGNCQPPSACHGSQKSTPSMGMITCLRRRDVSRGFSTLTPPVKDDEENKEPQSRRREGRKTDPDGLKRLNPSLFFWPRGVGGERRRRQPVPGDAPARHHPLALLRHLPVLGRPRPAHPAAPVAAAQAHPHGRHRLLAGPLDVARHRGQDRSHGSELHGGSGSPTVTSFQRDGKVPMIWILRSRQGDAVWRFLEPQLSGAQALPAPDGAFTDAPRSHRSSEEIRGYMKTGGWLKCPVFSSDS